MSLDYNIVSKEMIELSLSTFQKDHMVMSQLYRTMKYTYYHEFVTSLIIVEQNNDILLHNYNLRPARSLTNEIHAVDNVNAS